MTMPPGAGPTGTSATPVSYVPGSWTALTCDDVTLLLEFAASSEVIGACWTAASGGHGIDGVLAAISAAQPGTVPDFALVTSGAAGTRVVVGGRARIEVSAPERPEPLVVTAAETSRWLDQRLPGRPTLRLSGGDDAPADPSAGALPLSGGVVAAGSITVGLAAYPDAPPSDPSAAAADAPAPQVPAEPVQEPAPEPLPDPLGEQGVSNDTVPPRSDFDSGLIDSLPWRRPDAYAESDHPVPVEPDPEQQDDAAPAQPLRPTWGEPPTSTWPDTAAGAPAVPGGPGPQGGAGRPEWPAPPRQPEWPPPPQQQGWSQPGRSGQQPGQPGQQPGQPASPWAPPGADQPQPQQQPQQPQQQPARAEQGPSAQPMVHAFACPRQHLNPPYAGNCRVCGEPLPPQEGFTAPRPPLGVLAISTGESVPLDRDVVLGRAPFHPDENSASRPHLVQLSSPGNDISRSHVRVSLENWFVQVTDLGSTNGTVVTPPDQAPVRLRPHDPYTILAGTTITIADEVTVRYEASG